MVQKRLKHLGVSFCLQYPARTAPVWFIYDTFLLNKNQFSTINTLDLYQHLLVYHFFLFKCLSSDFILFCLPPTTLVHLSVSLLMKVKVKVIQSCLTLGNPMDYTVHGALQARILEWLAFPFFRGSSIWTWSEARKTVQVCLLNVRGKWKVSLHNSRVSKPQSVCAVNCSVFTQLALIYEIYKMQTDQR